MTPAEIEVLVEQVGEEILGRLGLPASTLQAQGAPPEAPASAWPRPEGGYAAALELLCSGAETSPADVRAACRQGREAGVAVVWTPTRLLAEAVSALRGSATRAGALVDFPRGGSSTAARLADLEMALRLGAEVVNLALSAGFARASGVDVIEAEVRAAALLCSGAGAALAATFEADLLSEEDLARAAGAARAGGADALCASVGRNPSGFASPESAALLRQAAGNGAVIIAAGRVGGFGHGAALIAAGADRIAAEDPWAILAEAPGR